ncbi:DUF1772 domain-containing protein [Methylobacterium haplocladii]|uniref:DUF1772 domain-containing protein n=1 Tax=Methylobacterium haplocladii TaxID=1176176 RepID=A0A512ITD3_9HYPH|nr:DUF1772 domain-containing protein [Methylobacterium haplocladii]GEP00899.1 hypothetical protein MHA02_32860 [Methylobacterium haplocladii]GJD82225.1 hypothetical protein HPGCJGGD_0077 [Methylobacterium haplocladii]GLS58869.1 hypothetical protein GCM10007887_15350 [Methylobacterium haplocladii]
MILGQLAFFAAALFTGAAFYINAVEQPARLGLDDHALLAQWKPSYKRATAMQVSLVLVSFVFGFAAWIRMDNPGWIVGALLMLANIPVTLRLILPVNKRLMAIDPAEAGPESRALILRWGSLHAIRTGLGLAASTAYATGLLA